MPEPHTVATSAQWLKARRQLLAREKELTRLRDEVTRQRRKLPWEPVEKEYVFDAPGGSRTLADLFDGRRQLVVYHFMFEPEADAGCKHCSFWADNFDPIVVHLNAHGISFAAASRAPLGKLEAYRERMGWSFTWVSAGGDDFNRDFGVGFAEDELDRPVYNYGTIAPGLVDREGVSVFATGDTGAVFHTYSAYARGIDLLNTAYNFIDLTPEGRGEEGRNPQWWVERHDEYV